ncbi:MAG: NAD(P)-dependent oxidoreductase [Acidimicrobiales bacterium]|nr:NAD(P)-dependent oxidoreductase [Acidimicrobiales bacterium]
MNSSRQASNRTPVLVHLWGDHFPTDTIRNRFPTVDFISVPTEGVIPDGVTAKVCITQAAHNGNLAEVLDRGVTWVHELGQGVDHFPFDQLGDRTLTCARGGNAVPIAEWVVTMLLTAAKQLPSRWVSEPPRHWTLANLDTLDGAKVVFLGFGTINRAAAKRLAPFGCHMVAVNRSGVVDLDLGVSHAVEVTTDASKAVAGADHIVVGVPLTPATAGMIDETLLAAMKPGAHLVNIARGQIIDQEAMRRSLDAGHLGLASLDVCHPEPLPAGHWLYHHPRVRLSPHVSWSDPGSLDRLHTSFTDNLERWLTGEPLIDVVDVVAGY